MAKWRKVAKACALASQQEVKVLREVILVDGHISKSEYDFLLEIKAEVKTSVKV